MTEETIQKDVSQAEGQDAPTTSEAQVADTPEQERPVARTREEKMAQVAEAAKAQREADRKSMALINNPDLTEEEYDAQQVAASESTDNDSASDEEERDAEDAGELTAGEESEEAVTAEAEEETKPETENGWYEREDGVRVKRMKINGELREFTEEEYDRAVSKEFAGDQKLRLAAERQRQLDERERQLQERLSQQQEPRELPTGQSDAEFAEKLSKYHDAVYDGDTDTANKLMAEMIAGRSNPTPNIAALVDEAVTARAHQEAQERHAASARRGWERFEKDYAEIASDDRYLAFADANLKIVRAENPDWEPEKVILETGRRTAEDLGISKKQVKEDQPSKSSQSADRMARKAKLKSVPSTGSGAKAEDRAPVIDMSPKAKIARLRAGRAV